MAEPYARVETAHGSFTMSHAELDQLRMLIDVSLRTDTVPEAKPPIRTDQYEDLRDFINESFDQDRGGETTYLNSEDYPDFEEGDPCPECGESERFGATCKSHGTLYFNEGRPVDYKENHVGETLVLQCLECDTTLIDKLE